MFNGTIKTREVDWSGLEELLNRIGGYKNVLNVYTETDDNKTFYVVVYEVHNNYKGP